MFAAEPTLRAITHKVHLGSSACGCRLMLLHPWWGYPSAV